MKEADFSNVEVGQRVFSILHGWGKVVDLKKNFLGMDDLITVMFDENRNRASFSIDGRSHGWESVYPTLYYDWVWIDGPKSAFVKPETHKIGNRYKYVGNSLDRNSTYILSGYKDMPDVAFLINERTGFAVNYPKLVKNLSEISMDEWMRITNEKPEDYEKMED
jgi:hypothetical protein